MVISVWEWCKQRKCLQSISEAAPVLRSHLGFVIKLWEKWLVWWICEMRTDFQNAVGSIVEGRSRPRLPGLALLGRLPPTRGAPVSADSPAPAPHTHGRSLSSHTHPRTPHRPGHSSPTHVSHAHILQPASLREAVTPPGQQ